LRGVIGQFLGAHTAVVIAASIVCVAIAASVRSARIPTFCTAVIATILVSWHAHLYDALLLLIPMAWLYESDSAWIRQTPNVLIVLTLVILPYSRQGYWVGIFLCLLLSVLLAIARHNAPKRNPNPSVNFDRQPSRDAASS
jgi:hypothetical protein